jgi:hypothetical protein
MAKFLKTPLFSRFLAEVFAGDQKCFSVRGCRQHHISPETRARV